MPRTASKAAVAKRQDYSFKILVLGDVQVGKTSFATCLAEGLKVPSRYKNPTCAQHAVSSPCRIRKTQTSSLQSLDSVKCPSLLRAPNTLSGVSPGLGGVEWLKKLISLPGNLNVTLEVRSCLQTLCRTSQLSKPVL